MLNVKKRLAIETLLFCGLAFIVSLIHWNRHPGLIFNVYYLEHDPGVNLYLADQLDHGKLLYKDAAYPYGPLGIYLYYAWSNCFGNSIASYAILQTSINFVFLALLFFLVRRTFSGTVTWAVMSVALLPHALTLGAPYGGGHFWGAYIQLERVWFLIVCCCWKPPQSRTWSRFAVIGFLLAFWQVIKFGGCFITGASILALDILVLWQQDAKLTDWKRWFLGNLVTLSAFLVGEAVWAVWVFSTYDFPLAIDIVWPLYIKVSYDTFPKGIISYHVFSNWKYFVACELGLVAAAICSSIVILLLFLKKCAEIDKLWVMIFALFYLGGALIYFNIIEHFQQFAWCLVISSIFLLDRANLWQRFLVVICWVPTFAMMLKITCFNPVPNYETFTFPNGEMIYLSKEEKIQIESALDSLKKLGCLNSQEKKPRVLIFPVASGFHHYYNLRPFSRHIWYITKFIRPHDEATILANLEDTRAILFTAPVFLLKSDTSSWEMELRKVFSPEVVQSIIGKSPVSLDTSETFLVVSLSTPAEVEQADSNAEHSGQN